MSSPAPYLSTNEVAHQLDTHPSAVVRWIVRGTPTKGGERVRLRRPHTRELENHATVARRILVGAHQPIAR